MPLENEEGLGFCKKDAYLSTLHPRLLTSSSLEVDLIRILLRSLDREPSVKVDGQSWQVRIHDCTSYFWS